MRCLSYLHVSKICSELIGVIAIWLNYSSKGLCSKRICFSLLGEVMYINRYTRQLINITYFFIHVHTHTCVQFGILLHVQFMTLMDVKVKDLSDI